MKQPPSRNVEPPQWGNESGINKVVVDGDGIAQFEHAQDVCECDNCHSSKIVTIYPEGLGQTWQCENCGHVQLWVPSDRFKEAYDFASKTSFVKIPKISTNPNKYMGKLTLDALAKMDRGDVNSMSASDALEALLACDTAAGGLNEVIGMAAQKGYNTEFVSGVIADIGKLRDLKQLLHDKLEQEVV